MPCTLICGSLCPEFLRPRCSPIAAYRMAQQGWTAKEAMQEMHEFGYRGLHHLMCPGLAGYEKSFPQRLQNGRVLENLR